MSIIPRVANAGDLNGELSERPMIAVTNVNQSHDNRTTFCVKRVRVVLSKIEVLEALQTR